MSHLTIIPNDEYVAEISNASIDMLTQAAKRLGLEETVYLVETAFGHIAQFEIANHHHDKLLRIHKKDILFLESLPGIRWFEFGEGEMEIAFCDKSITNKKTIDEFHAIKTTSGKTFTYDQSKQLARLIVERFGGEDHIMDAWKAWQRLLENNCSFHSFNQLVNDD